MIMQLTLNAIVAAIAVSSLFVATSTANPAHTSKHPQLTLSWLQSNGITTELHRRNQQHIGSEFYSYEQEAPLLRMVFLPADVISAAYEVELSAAEAARGYLPDLRNLAASATLQCVPSTEYSGEETLCDASYSSLHPLVVVCEFDAKFRDIHRENFKFFSKHHTQLATPDRVSVTEELEGRSKADLRAHLTSSASDSQWSNAEFNSRLDHHGTALRSQDATNSWLCSVVHRSAEAVADVHGLELECGYDLHAYDKAEVLDEREEVIKPHTIQRVEDHHFGPSSTRIPNELPLPFPLNLSHTLDMIVEETEHHLMSRIHRRGVLHRLDSNVFPVGAAGRGKELLLIGSRVCRLKYRLSRHGRRPSPRGSHFSRLALRSQAVSIAALLTLVLLFLVSRKYWRRRKVH